MASGGKRQSAPDPQDSAAAQKRRRRSGELGEEEPGMEADDGGRVTRDEDSFGAEGCSSNGGNAASSPTSDDFRAGSIRRVRLENFLTYDSVEFFPGPRLNVVVGPNGTGKSTILCALCLGLGGEPGLLGRADDARAFIQHNKDVATVEIELVGLHGNDRATIRRTIDRNAGSEKGRGRGASTWMLDGRKTTKAAVKELVTKDYAIAIDNLCTFLPQDKVGDFSGYTPRDVLRETQKALSGAQMYGVHQRLIALEEELTNSNRTVESVGDKLKELRTENEHLEREKQRMEERRAACDKVQLIEKKRLWLDFDAARQHALKIKEDRALAKKELLAAQSTIAPVQKKADDLEAEFKRGTHRGVALDEGMKQCRRDHDVFLRKADRFADTIEVTQSEIRNVDVSQRKAEVAVRRLEEKQVEAEESMKQLPPKEVLQKAMDAIKAELRAARPPIDAAKRERDLFLDRTRDLGERATTARTKLDRMGDEKARRRDRIFMQQPNLRKTFEWVDGSRKAFRRPVWGPVVLEVAMKDMNSAAYLEKHVPQSVLKSYVVECKEDYNLLYREVREKLRLPINISIVPGGALEPVRRGLSEERMAILRKEHGVVGFLDETFTAPDAVMQAIINAASVNAVLVGTGDTQRSIDERGLLKMLASRENGSPTGYCIFSSTERKAYRYTGSVSRYSRKVNLSMEEVSPARFLAPGVPQEQKESAQKQLDKIQVEIDELRPKVEEVDMKYRELQSQAKAYHADFAEASQKMKSYNEQRRKVDTARSRLADERKNASKDYAAEKGNLTAQLKKHIKNYLVSLDSALQKHDELMGSTFIYAGIKMNEEGLRERAQKAREYYDEKRLAQSTFEVKVQELSQTFTNAKTNLKALKELADRDAPMVDSNGNELPLKELLGNLPDEIDEIDAMKEELLIKINTISDNPGVIREYERRKKEIQEQEHELEQFGEEQDMKKRELTEIMLPWESRLINTVKKVDVLFKEYMKELNFVGEVKLYTGDDEEDRTNDDDGQNYNFKDWGIQLLVQFRSNSSIAILSAQIHSGGERSVSTIMYLMALQDMMISPFRCVDEINQGLDERNERLVFRRIVRNSTNPSKSNTLRNDHSGQYFLITPKLLPNLTDMENKDVTILFVFNGPFNFENYSDWNVGEFCSKISAKASENERPKE